MNENLVIRKILNEQDEIIAEVVFSINLDSILGDGNSTLTLTSGAS